MPKTIIFFLILFFLILPNLACVLAINDPLTTSNNKFGIHIIDGSEIENAADLVNSNGGEWGYVTFVIRQDERDHNKWQKIFDVCRRKKIIPIVRIATKIDGDKWEAPNLGEIDGWVNFLNSLNWVIQNRYVVIGNEPNHAKEWGGQIDPKAYTQYLREFSIKLKKVSPDFFVLNAGFDASASKTKETLGLIDFISGMLSEDSHIFSYIDGWVSHSYPNPSFSAPANLTGRGSIKSFDWEINYLKETKAIDRDLPIFILETGWRHSGEKKIKSLLTPDKVSERIKYSIDNVWNDPRIVAITPFILNYNQDPFDEFSWKKPDGSLWSFAQAYKDTPKIKGEPIQIQLGQILSLFGPHYNPINNSFFGTVVLQNLGQTIWSTKSLSFYSPVFSNISINLIEDENIEPYKLKFLTFTAKIDKNINLFSNSFELNESGNTISKPIYFQLFTINQFSRFVNFTQESWEILKYFVNR